jgi:hypothetical protein
MDLELKCPHCSQTLIVNTNDINCGIFRHAVFKNNMQPINPHESEANCTQLVNNGLVYGCAKPFKLTKDSDDKYHIESCDYI